MIAHLVGLGIQVFDGDIWFEIQAGIGQGFQFFKVCRHLLLRQLGGLVIVESPDDKRNPLQKIADDRKQIGLADFLSGGHELARCHAVDRILK